MSFQAFIFPCNHELNDRNQLIMGKKSINQSIRCRSHGSIFHILHTGISFNTEHNNEQIFRRRLHTLILIVYIRVTPGNMRPHTHEPNTCILACMCKPLHNQLTTVNTHA